MYIARFKLMFIDACLFYYSKYFNSIYSTCLEVVVVIDDDKKAMNSLMCPSVGPISILRNTFFK